MKIIVKNIPIKSHHSIELVERYHVSYCQIYSIITAEILRIKPELALQMFSKTLNNLVKPNSFIPSLLIFDAYHCITDMDAFSPASNQQSTAMCKVIEEVRRSHDF